MPASPPPLFDTHAHLDDASLEGQHAEILDRARQAGVVGIVAVGCTADSSRRCCELAAAAPDLLCAAVGIQPNYVAEATEDDFAVIQSLAGQPPVRAIGETGLDCYWKDSPLPLQRDLFERHLDLAARCRLPMIIHMRDSGAEIVDQLRPWAASGSLRGVMHSFTGDWTLAKTCLDLGLYLSFAGMVTFKKSAELRDVARRVPEDRLLIETDSPYLSPEPHRGKRPNEPARVAHTAACLAQTRGVSLRQLAEVTTANARELFGIGAG